MAKATTIQQIFEAMPKRFSAEKAGELSASVQFDLTGEGGGQYYANIANGQCQVAQGTAANPTMVLTAAASDYLAMINGELNPMQAFMQGKVKIKGDIGTAMKLQSLFQ